MMSDPEKRAPRNRTIVLSEERKRELAARLVRPDRALETADFENRVFLGRIPECVRFFPRGCVDLLFLDPPYNLDKSFHQEKFRRMGEHAYSDWLDSWFPLLLPLLKPSASIYLCGEWHSSAALADLLERHCVLRSRIVWQREKGRGAKANWKNACEDIWFATAGNDYYFDLESVKVRRRVLAPYRLNGEPKDWREEENGRFRLTCPGNFWDDLTVPYWSMPENTDHPTQKPEKLLAKLILASCPPGGLVFDPFLGSGTSAVVARKLGRRFAGVECDPDYCLLALERLERAAADPRIQGYENGVFRERNTPA